MGEWLELFRALGQALADLARAEVAALQAELARNGRTLALALGLFAAAAMFGFWLVALLLYTLIQVLALWLPPWGASAVVTGAVALAVAVLALVGLAKLKKLESPGATLGRRWRDHRGWWDGRLLAAPVPASELPGAGLPGQSGERDELDELEEEEDFP